MNELEHRLPGYREVCRTSNCLLLVKEDKEGTHVLALRIIHNTIVWPRGYISGSTYMLVEKR